MKKIATILVMGILLTGSACIGAFAGDYRGNWHGDIQHFQEYDAGRWHSGYWSDHFHDGRNGWWWVVNADWYYYPAPVYPYPDPYMPYTVIQQPLPGAPQYWYCQNPPGYYPYVAACYVQWQSVPAGVAQPVIPQMPAIEPATQRDADDRQLNKFAGEFYQIKDADEDAPERLKKLKAQVEEFHQSLFKKNYNAMDILKDAEDLEKRIGKKEAEIRKKI